MSSLPKYASVLDYRRLSALLVGFLALLLAHWIGHLYRIGPAVSLWFPPSGLGITLTLWLGPVGALLTALASITMAPLWGSNGWARMVGLGDAIEPLIAWFLYIKCFRASLSLSTVRDAVSFLLTIPVAACMSSAIVGNLIFILLGKSSIEHLDANIGNWWLGNAVGVLSITPTALLLLGPYLQSWLSGRPLSKYEPCQVFKGWNSLEFALIIFLSMCTAWLTVLQSVDSSFALQQLSLLHFIPIIWAATRFGTTGGMLIATLTVMITLLDYIILYPNALYLSKFPVDADWLVVHKLSLLVQCAVGLLVGVAMTEKEATLVAITEEKVKSREFQIRAGLGDKLFQLNRLLREKNQQLEKTAQELNILNGELTHTGDLLMERNQELERFVYVVSHDLKAPLRAITNLSEWIEDDFKAILPAENRKQMELLRARVKRMESLIDGLLSYSRIGRMEVEEESVNVAELLSEILDSIAPPPTFIIEISSPLPTLYTKRLLLSQIFTNLISNAIKHHPRPDGEINIGAIDKGDDYEFWVSDDGNGIAKEDQERIFGIFQTLSRQSDRENTGIGLSIVKKILEIEGGKISLESELGKGSTFRFTWPKTMKSSH
ncbi:MAG: Adaptive-response sensory-kinase SasA [Chroococcopsis gigantea SAG 12.99]|jgi:signal transduction histidine kinase|nr:MASE1 domain-containing protein [Chlorogloea purpurea SAG 13.99]MDV3000803.1 Adaptive-response sensory-kinase SasA [Chroococcopsis gigantea SAG 12.99]